MYREKSFISRYAVMNKQKATEHLDPRASFDMAELLDGLVGGITMASGKNEIKKNTFKLAFFQYMKDDLLGKDKSKLSPEELASLIPVMYTTFLRGLKESDEALYNTDKQDADPKIFSEISDDIENELKKIGSVRAAAYAGYRLINKSLSDENFDVDQLKGFLQKKGFNDELLKLLFEGNDPCFPKDITSVLLNLFALSNGKTQKLWSGNPYKTKQDESTEK